MLQKLEIEQKLSQGLSQQTIQYLQILQMNLQELNEYINNEVIINPILDTSSYVSENYPACPEADRTWIESGNLLPETAAENSDTLREHLMSQLDFSRFSEELGRALDTVISSLDDNGRLTEPLENLVKISGVSEKDILRAEKIITSLNPVGVGARSLKQCLAIQIEKNSLVPEDVKEMAKVIVRDYLEDLGKQHLHKIASETGCSRQLINRAREFIISLNPCPGASFPKSGEITQFIVPDVLVEKSEEGLAIIYNSEYEPGLTVNPYYLELLKTTDDEEVREYLSVKQKNAENLIANMERRRNMLKKCVAIITECQEDFFRYGPRYLKPLLIKDIAAVLGVHESTVSRAISDKYLQCDFGVFSLRSFFSYAAFSTPVPGGSISNELSPQRIKLIIKEMIEKESLNKALSDQQICDRLNSINIPISRRTVTKYREQLGIPTKSLRRTSPDQAP